MTSSKGPLFPRILALVAGVVLLLAAASISLGIVLLAPLGAYVARTVTRRRGLTKLSSWTGAVVAVGVGVIAAALYLVSLTPRGTMSRVFQTADSVSAAQAHEPPPAWIQRMSPNVQQRAALARPASPGMQRAMLIWGTGIGIGAFIAFLGTVGWVGVMLIIFYGTGGWLYHPPPLSDSTTDPVAAT